MLALQALDAHLGQCIYLLKPEVRCVRTLPTLSTNGAIDEADADAVLDTVINEGETWVKTFDLILTDA